MSRSHLNKIGQFNLRNTGARSELEMFGLHEHSKMKILLSFFLISNFVFADLDDVDIEVLKNAVTGVYIECKIEKVNSFIFKML